MAYGLRVGSRVKIINSRKKSYIGKTGKIIAKGNDNFFGKRTYLVSVPKKEKAIWQYPTELEKEKKDDIQHKN